MMRLGIVATALLLASVACGGGNVFSLDVGDCFNDPDNFSEVSDVELKDCQESHDNEVFALFDMPDGSFPGDSTIRDAALTGCHNRFEAYVGRAYLQSSLDYTWLSPTQASWDAGDREIVCVVYEGQQRPLTVSVKHSGL